MASVEIACRYCAGVKVHKHGRSQGSDLQRYRCQSCGRCFQHEYRYEGRKQGTHEKIVDMAMNGSGVNDTARVLGVSNTTVIAVLKNSRRHGSTPSLRGSRSGNRL